MSDVLFVEFNIWILTRLYIIFVVEVDYD